MNDQDLKDLFAGLALQRVIWYEGREEDAAKRCYKIAEAMIQEKNRQKEICGNI